MSGGGGGSTWKMTRVILQPAAWHFCCVIKEDLSGTGGNCDSFSDGFIFFFRDPLLIWEEGLLMGQEQSRTDLINLPEILYESVPKEGCFGTSWICWAVFSVELWILKKWLLVIVNVPSSNWKSNVTRALASHDTSAHVAFKTKKVNYVWSVCACVHVCVQVKLMKCQHRLQMSAPTFPPWTAQVLGFGTHTYTHTQQEMLTSRFHWASS